MAAVRRRNRAFAILLTDLSLPDMDGRDLAERIRERHPDVLAVFVSGRHEPSELPAWARYVPKPIDFDALEALLQALARGGDA